MSETMPILRSDDRTSWIPVSQAAKLLRVTRQRVYQLIELGLVHGRKVDRTWLVSSRSVESRVALLLREGGS